MSTQSGYSFSDKQHEENFDYEEFYGSDAYLRTWNPLQTEAQRVKQLSHASLVEQFTHALVQQWQCHAKRSRPRLALPLGQYVQTGVILRAARPFSELLKKQYKH